MMDKLGFFFSSYDFKKRFKTVRGVAQELGLAQNPETTGKKVREENTRRKIVK